MLSRMGACVLFALVVVISIFGVSAGNVFHLHRAFPMSHRVELEQLQAQDTVRHHQFLGGVVNLSVAFPKHIHSLIGVYLTKVKIGSPPREFYVLIDTGSEVFWVSCSSCNVCPRFTGLGTPISLYDYDNSSTAGLLPCSDRRCKHCSDDSNQCEYNIPYTGGAETTGYFVSDEFSFDMIPVHSQVAHGSSTPIIFGCATTVSGLLARTEVSLNGVLGLSQGPLSVISQLSSRGITPSVFSHCLKGDGNGGGILVLGEILEPSIVYTPLVPKKSYYAINLESIAVNGQILPIDPATFRTSDERATFVDTGTTLAFFVEEAYEPLVHAITSASNFVSLIISGELQCYLTYTSLGKSFPSVTLNFAAGASMTLKPQDYLLYSGSHVGAAMWCLGFKKAHGASRGFTMLGDLVLRDKILVYDLARQQLGWANYNCASPVNFSTAFHPTHQSGSSGSSGDTLIKLLKTGIVLLLMHLFNLYM
ncbi:aspartic proteinase-like protein 2 [Pyrus ussuriensis x Pyrus communis]|uniref:Aspartic proteinase-like protein 2 n=1 Tax=Pyrus ussuriensis x Pyrus communis TaxID=2448454 RepID=A0A5N5HHE8_9ROSA|nr:aspartic proteinase-like protein 2 [Pyrus ussuriensis x Pyrus communis]